MHEFDHSWVLVWVWVVVVVVVGYGCGCVLVVVLWVGDRENGRMNDEGEGDDDEGEGEGEGGDGGLRSLERHWVVVVRMLLFGWWVMIAVGLRVLVLVPVVVVWVVGGVYG